MGDFNRDIVFYLNFLILFKITIFAVLSYLPEALLVQKHRNEIKISDMERLLRGLVAAGAAVMDWTPSTLQCSRSNNSRLS